MILDFIIVLVTAFIETFLYTIYLLFLNRGKKINSSVMMTLYTTVYLILVKFILAKDNATSSWMIIIYAVSCGGGNYFSMWIDSNYNKIKRRWYKRFARRRQKK